IHREARGVELCPSRREQRRRADRIPLREGHSSYPDQSVWSKVRVSSLVRELQTLTDQRHGIGNVSFEDFEGAQVYKLAGHSIRSLEFPVQREGPPIEFLGLAEVPFDARRCREHVQRSEDVRLLA